jgi:hypothetical protein
MAEGLTNQEKAQRLRLAEGTVKVPPAPDLQEAWHRQPHRACYIGPYQLRKTRSLIGIHSTG